MTELLTTRYELLGLLGEGGMGRVSRAWDQLANREVALKQILSEDANPTDLKQEFWWMSRLRDPHLVEVYDFGVDEGGRPYFTMEVVEGHPLDEGLPLAPEVVTDMLRQVCRALRRIHHEGLIHGDIKPENIRVRPDGRLTLMDFGLMSPAGQVQAVRGTLAYMAPEVIQRCRVDQRADLYALGALAYQLLTGRPPFEATSTAALLRAHLEELPVSPSRLRLGLDPMWDRLVARLLAKEPARRYQSAAEVLEVLGEAVSDEPAALLCAPFVGRETEIEVFEAALVALREERRGRTLWIGGVAGIGKSRLLDEFGLRAQLEGHAVCQAAAAGVGAPYQPFVQVLRQVWPDLVRHEAGLIEIHAPALHGLAPDLVPDASVHRLEPEQEKLRLHAALVELLTALVQRRGLVLLLDEWHAADPLSIEALATLQRQLLGQPLLLVLAGDGPSAADAEPFTLAPLGRRELGRMIGAMFGAASPPGAFVGQVAELSGGVPLAAETFLEHLVSSGLLPQTGGRWVLEPLPAERLPAGADAILANRLADLSPLARRILEVAAVVGAPFGLDVLLRLVPDAPEEAVYAALAALEHGHLLRHRAGAYQVEQGHLAEVLRHRLAPEVLRDLHTRVGEALEESQAGQDPDDLLVRMANHFLAGDRPVKAVNYALTAAQRLAAMFANDQARSLVQRGHALLEGGVALPEGQAGATRAAYLSLLGDLRRVAGGLDDAEALYARGVALAEAAGASELVARMRVGEGLVHQSRGHQEPALEHFKAALPLCRAHAGAREELRCLAAMGRAYYQLGDPARSAATYEEALARAVAVGDLAYQGECLGFLGLLAVSAEPVPGQPSRASEGLDYLKQSIAIKEAVGDKLGLNDTHMLLGNALLALGDLPASEHSFLRNQALCHEIGAFEEVIAYLNLALVAIERGDHLAALDRAQKAAEIGEPIGNRFALDLAVCLEARALLNLGMLARPLPMLEDALARTRAADDAYGELFALTWLVEAQLHLGRWSEAEAALLEALNAQAATGLMEFAFPLQLYTAMLALRRGNRGAAEATLREGLARAEAKEAQLWEAQFCAALAEVALEDEAAAHEALPWLLRAQDRATACDALALAARCHWLRGRLAMVTGDFIEADGHFQRAQDSAVQLNLLDLMARVWYDRGVLQFPSPQSVKLLRRAQEVMVQQVDGFAAADREAFLAAAGRGAVWRRELPGQAAGTGPDGVPTAFATPEEDEGEPKGKLSEARQIIAQQRVWLDELQLASGLLLKQLDFAQAILRAQEAGPIMSQALALVLEISQAARGEVLLLEGARLVPRARKSLANLKPIEDDWTDYAETVTEVAQSGVMRYIPDTHAAGLAGHRGWEPRSLLVLPLSDERERLGVLLAFGHPEDAGRLMKRELEALRVLANQLAGALRNARMQSEWREKTQRLEMLYQLSSSVTSTLVMDEVLDLVLKLSLEITTAERGFLFLTDERGELRGEAARHAHGPLDARVDGELVSQSILRRVLETGEAVCVEDARDDDVLRHQKSIQDLNLRTVMAVPLAVKQRAFGVLYVDSRLVVNTFSDRDLELLKAIASHASVALENARLYDLATVDRLTKLFFRSHFEQRMREELARAQRHGHEVALLMMDIDHFKKFNDTYGHAVGDLVLAHVAGVIRNNLRQECDVPCRYGGEEMVVLLPETDVAGAAIFAERIRQAIDETRLTVEGHGDLHVTISIGTATYQGVADTGLALMERADQALYASKRGGRNRVTAYAPDLGG